MSSIALKPKNPKPNFFSTKKSSSGRSRLKRLVRQSVLRRARCAMYRCHFSSLTALGRSHRFLLARLLCKSKFHSPGKLYEALNGPATFHDYRSEEHTYELQALRHL